MYLNDQIHIWQISVSQFDINDINGPLSAAVLTRVELTKSQAIPLLIHKALDISVLTHYHRPSRTLALDESEGGTEAQATHLEIEELLSIVQALDTYLQGLAVAFAPCAHGCAEALPRLQGADARIELRAQTRARRLQRPVSSLDLAHCCSRRSPPSTHTLSPACEENKE